MIPLLSPKPFRDFSPADFKAYVISLYVAPSEPKKPADWVVRLNAKGNPVITVRREPKELTSAEVTEMAAEVRWPLQRLWLHLLKKRILIKVPQKQGRKK